MCNNMCIKYKLTVLLVSLTSKHGSGRISFTNKPGNFSMFVTLLEPPVWAVGIPVIYYKPNLFYVLSIIHWYFVKQNINCHMPSNGTVNGLTMININ